MWMQQKEKEEGSSICLRSSSEKRGEYGRRLNKYLETHWRGALRLHSFTKPETLLAAEEPADCWILGEPFVQALQEAGRMTRDFRQRCIRLSGEEGGDAFCRYHSPAELLHRIEELQKNPAAPPAAQ